MEFKSLCFILFIIILSTGCATVKAQYKSINESTSFTEITKPIVEIKVKNKKGDTWAELKSRFLDSGIIMGKFAEDETGDVYFSIEKIKFLANWPNGWTYGECDASGELLLRKNDNEYNIEVIDKFEMWDLKKGEIRYFDDYYRGDEGLKKVKDRLTRIQEVIKFLKENEQIPQFFEYFRFGSEDAESFIKTAKKFLFPETVDINYIITHDESERSDYQFGNGIFWKKSYTKEVFPENLYKLRNTGSLWRDFEEAPGIYYMLYNMDYFFENILDGLEIELE